MPHKSLKDRQRYNVDEHKQALGLFQDSSDILESALLYLDRNYMRIQDSRRQHVKEDKN